MKQVPKPGDVIAVWFSCGAASAVAARETLRQYGDRCTVRVLNNPVAEEDDDNRRFLRDVEQWLGVTVESVTNPFFPNASAEEVWDYRSYMAGVSGAPCTNTLKKAARRHWQRHNHVDWHVLGFVAGEEKRHSGFVENESANLLPVLIDTRLTKGDCYQVLFEAGIEVPRMYKLGYPNANCIGCVKATSPTYWNHVRQQHPEVFQRRAEQSRRLGARLVRVKGQRYFLDELHPDTQGRPMKDMDFECGVFCAPKPEED